MPNWCFNTLTVDATTEGGKALVEAFRPKYKYEDSDGLYARPFQDLMPCPDALHCDAGFFGEGTDKEKEMLAIYASNKANHGYAHWYDWQVANWGTKWDLADLSVDRTERTIFLNYNTAWSPNIPFWTYFSKVYPSLKIVHNYLEEGMCFIGEAEYQDGEVNDYCIDIDQNLWKLAGATFDEDGYVNNHDDASLWKLFPLSSIKEKELS